jgi:hypothetical protein
MFHSVNLPLLSIPIPVWLLPAIEMEITIVDADRHVTPLVDWIISPYSKHSAYFFTNFCIGRERSDINWSKVTDYPIIWWQLKVVQSAITMRVSSQKASKDGEGDLEEDRINGFLSVRQYDIMQYFDYFILFSIDNNHSFGRSSSFAFFMASIICFLSSGRLTVLKLRAQ